MGGSIDSESRRYGAIYHATTIHGSNSSATNGMYEKGYDIGNSQYGKRTFWSNRSQGADKAIRGLCGAFLEHDGEPLNVHSERSWRPHNI